MPCHEHSAFSTGKTTNKFWEVISELMLFNPMFYPMTAKEMFVTWQNTCLILEYIVNNAKMHYLMISIYLLNATVNKTQSYPSSSTIFIYRYQIYLLI